MLSKPAAGSRQLIGLCFSLLENIELNSEVHLPGLGGLSPVNLTDLCSAITARPTNSLWWEEALHQWDEQQQERELEFGSSTQTTAMLQAPVYYVFIRETFTEWLL